MRRSGFSPLVMAAAMYFSGSAVVAQAQDAELPFDPVLTIGSTSLINDRVIANADGSFSMSGQQNGGPAGGAPVWDLAWDLTMHQDPFIAGSLTLSNLSGSTRNFNLALSLPVLPAFSPSLFGGFLSATVFDANLDGTALLAPSGVSQSIYRGTIDGVTVLPLFAISLACQGSGPGCSGQISDEFGLPGPTIPGPAVNSAIGIFLNFSLSAGDRVQLTTNFTVEPPDTVPVPAALPLLVSGLAFLGLRRRRATAA